MPKDTHKIYLQINFPALKEIDHPREFSQPKLSTAIDAANCLSDIFCNPVFAVKTQPGAMECNLTASFGEDDVF